MEQDTLELIWGVLVILFFTYILVLIIFSQSKHDLNKIKKDILSIITLKNSDINLFLILNIFFFLIFNYIYNYPIENIVVGTPFLSALYTSIINTYKIFLTSKIYKGRIIDLKGFFSITDKNLNPKSYRPFYIDKYIMTVKYNQDGVEKTGKVNSIYKKIGKSIYIFINRKDGEKAYPAVLLIGKAILITPLFILSLIVLYF